jgi:hypothetical protein
MDQKTIYSKTGRGVLEIKNKGGKLSKDLVKVLTLIDGKSTVADLVSKSRLPDADIARCIKQLEDGGYIKEFSSLSGQLSTVPPADTSYVDDLDFTATLAPGKKVYQSSALEMRAREEAERKKAEEEARRKREDEERRKKEAGAAAAREEAARLARVEAERKAKEAAAVRAREEAERKAKLQAEEMKKTTRDLSKVLEAERRALEVKSREETARRAKEEAEQKVRDNEERRKRDEDQRREEEARRKREEEEKRRQEDQRRQREEEEARRKREEEERRNREEEEARRRDEEEQRRREEEDARRRREEEERRRREEEEARRRREEEEARRKREEEERRRKEAEEKRREEEEARRTREDQARRQREEEDRRRREEEARSQSAALPEIQEIDLPPVASSATDFLAEFERQQETLRKQAEEEARQSLQVEQARLAAERAQREEEARLEAERRAGEEAEIRQRMQHEEEERRARERHREEEYQRKIQEQEERKKREVEDKQRAELAKIEADRKAREDELARKRRRTEEADRKRRELEALKKAGKVRSPLDRIKSIAIALVVVLGLAVAIVEFVPLSGYIPAMQKLASDHIQEPVTIGSVRMSALSGFDLTLQNVSIGTTQDVKISEMRVSPELGSLFGAVKVIRAIDIDSVTVAQEALQRFKGWLDASRADRAVQITRLNARNVKLELREMQVAPFNVSLDLADDGAISRAELASTDGKLSAEVQPQGGRARVSITGSGWTPPFGPAVEFTDLSAQGMATASSLELTDFDARLYGGNMKGSVQVSWENGWRGEGDFEFSRVTLASLLAAFTKDARTSGEVDGIGRFWLQSDRLAGLLDNPRVESSFRIRRGDLDGVDLVRALQAGRQGTQGGSTKFEELTGSLQVAGERYQYRNLRLAAGILTANGSLDIAQDQDISGRVYVELRSQAQQLRNNLNITGTLRAVVLRP